MYVLMQCVAEAVVAKGVRGLAELVPGGGFLYDIANEAHRRLRDRRRTDQIREEVVAVAAASVEEVRRVAEEVVREVAKDAAPADKAALELYLTQVPGAVRASFRRAEDPSGRSVPDQFSLHDGADLARRLPSRLPKFRPGEPLPGRPGWLLGELLGSGGFGEVWLARNPSLAALKGAVKFGTDPQARERLLRHEGGLVSRVMEEGRHPNIVPLLDAYLEGDTPWLMYEYVSGGELGTLIGAWQAATPADRVAKAVAALRTLAAAVGHFHRLSPPLVHRDLKPANILVRGTAAAPQLLVADFGIGGVAADAALAAEATRRSSGYLGSQLWGSHTPLYASPQQQRGEKPDPRDDVHALGVIGYQMLTGKLDAAPGADFARTLKRLNVPEPVIELLGDCAAHDPEHRPKDATEFAERLGKTDAPSVAPTAEPKVVACPSCGVSLRFRSGATTLRCARCGTVFNPSEASAPPKVAVVEAELSPPLPTARAVPVTTRRSRDDNRPRRDDDDRDRRRERPPAPSGGFNPMWIAGAAVAAAVFIGVMVFLVRGRGGSTPPPPVPPINPPAFVGGNPPPGVPGVPSGGRPAPRPRADLIKYVRDFTYAPAGEAKLFRHSPDGTALLVADAKGTVAVVGLDGKEQLKLDTGVAGFRPALFHEGGMLAAAAGFENRLSPCVIPLAGGVAEATELVGLGEKPTVMAVSKSGTWVAAGGEGGAVRVWKTAAPKSGFTLKVAGGELPHAGGVTAMTFSPDGKYLVTAGGGKVRSWVVSPEWSGDHNMAPVDGDVFEVGLTPDGKKLVAGVKTRGMRLWDFPMQSAGVAPSDGKLSDQGGFTRVVYGADPPFGLRLMTVTGTGKVGFWDGNPSHGFGPRGQDATAPIATDLVMSPKDANVVAASNADGTVLIWHLFHGQGPALRVSNFGGPVVGLSFTPDGKGLATVERSGRVRVWGDVSIPSHVGPPNELAAP